MSQNFRGKGSSLGIFFGFYKTRHILLSKSANCTVLRAVVLTQYRRVTDEQTDGQTDGRTELPQLIQRLQCDYCARCKNHQRASSYRRNSVPYKEIGIKESNDDVRNFNRKFINGRSCACAVKIWLKIALNAVRLPKFEPVNGISWSPRKIRVKDLRQRSGLA